MSEIIAFPTGPKITKLSTKLGSRVNFAAEESYPVPFKVNRSDAPNLSLTNLSLERLTAIRCSLAEEVRVTNVLLLPSLEPNGTMFIELSGHNLAVATLLVLRWFRPDGREYLWQISF